MSEDATSQAIAHCSLGSRVWPVLLLAAAGVVGWLVWTADPAIERSVIGMDGLALVIDDMRVVERPVPQAEIPALRVLPLYDNDAERSESNLGSRDLRQELRATTVGVVSRKLSRAPTLLVLTKWRLGALARSVFHPTYLVDPKAMRIPRTGRGVRVEQASPVFETFRPSGRFTDPVTLYAAQTLVIPSDHRFCTPVVWRGAERFGAVFLARCEVGRATFHVLSDPDLVNNHGLGLGENVTFARGLVQGLAGKGATDLDLTGDRAYTSPLPQRRDRSFADLARFFQGPFAPFWLALAVLAALALWRGGVRFGRADAGGDGFIEASRGSMIDADARLLRASGAVQPLLAAHAEQRLAALARRVLGRMAGSETFLEALARRAPAKAKDLRDLVGQVTASATIPAPKPWLTRFDRAVTGAAEEFEP